MGEYRGIPGRYAIVDEFEVLVDYCRRRYLSLEQRFLINIDQ